MKTRLRIGQECPFPQITTWLVRLWGLHSCESLEEKFFSCCSNSLMGFPPVLRTSEYSRSWQTLHTTEVWTRKPCVVFTNLCYQLGSGASSLCSLKSGHTHSVDLLCTSVCFILMETISHKTSPISTGCILDTSIRRAKVWCPFQSAQPTPNGSCRDFPGGSEVPMQGTRFWSPGQELDMCCS